MNNARVAGQIEALRDTVVATDFAERQQACGGEKLGAIFADDVEEMVQKAVLGMGGDERTAALLPNQDLFRRQFVNGLAQGTDADVELFRQPAPRWVALRLISILPRRGVR